MLFELNCDWLRIPTSQKSFSGSDSQTLFSAEPSDSWKYVCVRRLALGQQSLEYSNFTCNDKDNEKDWLSRAQESYNKEEL